MGFVDSKFGTTVAEVPLDSPFSSDKLIDFGPYQIFQYFAEKGNLFRNQLVQYLIDYALPLTECTRRYF